MIKQDKKERQDILRLYVSDEKIIQAITDDVAFTQSELDAIVAKHSSGDANIYICADRLSIPASASNLTFIGIGIPRTLGHGSPFVHVDDGHLLDRNRFINVLVSKDEKAERHEHGRQLSDTARDALHRTATGRGPIDAIYELGKWYADGQYVKKSRDEAAFWFTRAAAQGLCAAQSALGNLYFAKRKSNPEAGAQALYWYRLAARQGDSAAQMRYERLCYDGYGTDADTKEMIQSYRRRAESGDARFQYYLAELFHKGRYCEKDDAEAAQWFQRAAEQDHLDAQLQLAACLEQGIGVHKSRELAAYWYCRSEHIDDERSHEIAGLHARALKGDSRAQAALGEEYMICGDMTYSPINCQLLAEEGERWYAEAQRNGRARPNAEFLLGCAYDGDGFQTSREAAFERFKRAAAEGHTEAQYYLANYYSGLHGVPQNDELAFKWYSKAVRNSEKHSFWHDYWAVYVLAACYERGIGCRQDRAMAQKMYKEACACGGEIWDRAAYEGRPDGLYLFARIGNLPPAEEAEYYRRAAEQGHPMARYMLAQCYRKGHGVERNPRKAAGWRHLACEAPHAEGVLLDASEDNIVWRPVPQPLSGQWNV